MRSRHALGPPGALDPRIGCGSHRLHRADARSSLFAPSRHVAVRANRVPCQSWSGSPSPPVPARRPSDECLVFGRLGRPQGSCLGKEHPYAFDSLTRAATMGTGSVGNAVVPEDRRRQRKSPTLPSAAPCLPTAQRPVTRQSSGQKCSTLTAHCPRAG